MVETINMNKNLNTRKAIDYLGVGVQYVLQRAIESHTSCTVRSQAKLLISCLGHMNTGT